MIMNYIYKSHIISSLPNSFPYDNNSLNQINSFYKSKLFYNFRISSLGLIEYVKIDFMEWKILFGRRGYYVFLFDLIMIYYKITYFLIAYDCSSITESNHITYIYNISS